MDSTAAISYYTGYSSIDRYQELVFSYNYFSTLSLGIFCSLILPIVYLFFPSIFQTKRTWQLLIIASICLANMFCLFVHLYMLTNFGDLRLSIVSCRFIVYISTFAKPMGLYLTFLFAIERIYMKILPKTNYRLLFKRIYFLLICLTMILIFVIKFYQIMKYIPNVPESSRQKLNIPNDDDSNDDYNQNNTNGDINFQFCFRTMNVETYAKILSFYLVQYWYEYVIFALIIVILLFFIVYYYCLPYFHSRTLPSTSLNTKFYLILSISYIAFEIILQILHAIVDKEDNRNTDTEVNSLEVMLFIYNLRSIILPSLICLITTNELKQWLYDLFIFRSYLNQINENDQ